MSDTAATPPPLCKDAPPGWGEDGLTKYFDAARSNQQGSYVHKRPAVQRLIAIDALFDRISQNLMNPQNFIAALLLTRCHAAFRSAAANAMAGQVGEVYEHCRAMLERAAYAVHIERDPTLGPIWLDRHQDGDSMAAQRCAFSHQKVLASVKKANVSASERFEELYQRTIDFGGHPNERSVTGNLKMVQELDKRIYLSVMQHGDGIELDYALKVVAQCGLVSLEMLQVIFNARFELLGINAEMLALRADL
jgi:hypothetical protein